MSRCAAGASPAWEEHAGLLTTQNGRQATRGCELLRGSIYSVSHTAQLNPQCKPHPQLNPKHARPACPVSRPLGNRIQRAAAHLLIRSVHLVGTPLHQPLHQLQAA